MTIKPNTVTSSKHSGWILELLYFIRCFFSNNFIFILKTVNFINRLYFTALFICHSSKKLNEIAIFLYIFKVSNYAVLEIFIAFFDQQFKCKIFKPDTNLRFCVDYSSIYYIIQLIKNNSFRVRYGISNRKHCY